MPTFDLLLQPSATDGYTVRLADSPVGSLPPHPLFFDFSPAAEAAIASLAWAFAPDIPDIDESRETSLRAIGSGLHRALLPGSFATALHRSLDAARQQDDPLHLRLWLSATPELAALPWEALCDPQTGRFLAQDNRLILSRFLEVDEPVQPLTVSGPLRLLAVIADPQDQPRLAVEAEWQALQSATADAQASGRLELLRLEAATLPALQAALGTQPVHAVHFTCHGYFEETPDGRARSGLLLEDENGFSDFVEAPALAALLGNARTVGLALLNACDTAASAQGNAFTGTAQALVQQGIPAVVAMQTQISDGAAGAFARVFYRGLAGGRTPAAALSEARLALALERSPEWAIPLLFSRVKGGQLFEMAQADAAPAVLASRAHFEPELVHVPAGPFVMGRDQTDPRLPAPAPAETPAHEVALDGFFIGKYPVTNAEYAAFIRQTGTIVSPHIGFVGQSPPPGEGRHPVSRVSWPEALAYCRWLAQATGRAYRLPTEAEWEKAARGVDGRVYPWGDGWDPARCQADGPVCPVDAHPAQSVYGCCDLLGNAREWTLSLWGQSRRAPDRLGRYPWQADARNAGGAHLRRVLRGGSASPPQSVTCCVRHNAAPDRPGSPRARHGFRVVLAEEN